MDYHYWDIAAKQLEGKATPAEQEALRLWLEEDLEHRAQYQDQQKLWKMTAPAPAPFVDINKAWQKVEGRMLQEEQQAGRKTASIFTAAMRVAASVALLFSLLWLSWYLFFPYYGMKVVESGNRQISFMLPDSSQVWLNRNSRLIYDPDFDGTAREVQLSGEAFFEVQRNLQRPFIIQTNESLTKVLGTSFNLRAYADEAVVELVVATGRVAFVAREKAVEEAILLPGQAAVLVKERNAINQFNRLTANAWAWKTGILQFDGHSLQEVLQDLERYYDVPLQLQNSALANCRFTGSFKQAKLEEVLQVLTASLQLEYSQQADQTIILRGQGCK